MSQNDQGNHQTTPRPQAAASRASGWLVAGVSAVMLLILGGILAATAGELPGQAKAALAPTEAAIPAPRPGQPTATPPASPSLGEATPETGTKVGQLAPEFLLKTLDGETSLYDHLGKVVLLNFWASWCGPCRIEFPDIRAAYETYASQGLEVLAVNIGESAEAAGEFAEQFDLPFPILLDSEAGVARLYGAYSIPMSYFVDREGIVRKVRAGAMTKTYLDQVLQELMSQE